jgi:hypothetical protein
MREREVPPPQDGNLQERRQLCQKGKRYEVRLRAGRNEQASAYICMELKAENALQKVNSLLLTDIRMPLIHRTIKITLLNFMDAYDLDGLIFITISASVNAY